MKISLLNQNSFFFTIKSRHYLPLPWLVSVALFSNAGIQNAFAEDYFNPYALDKRGTQSVADVDSLAIFSQSEGQLPGAYTVEVMMNNTSMGIYDISFHADNKHKLQPELTKQQLVDWGINPAASSSLSTMDNSGVIVLLQDVISDSSTQFNFSQQKLIINVPQIAMNTAARGAVPTALWNEGIGALTLNYDFTGAQTWRDNTKNQQSQFLNLRSGLNIGAWRLRNYSIYSKNDDKHFWESINTNVERNIITIKSQLTLGEATTSGDIFEGFSFTGGQLASDDNMLPYSLRGFAPVVQGIAQTNAKVTVRQNGYIIYQTYVSAGPFEITDLYPTSSSGNLDVTVEEMNGNEQNFVVPFSSVPIMQREGQHKYTLSGGKYRSNTKQGKEPNFIQSTLIYGLPWNTTVYGGGIYSENYNALAIGTGLNLGTAGAVSFDMRDARTEFDIHLNPLQYHGQSYRFQYAKSLLSSGTTVTLAGYRYSTEGYYDFAEANDFYQSSTYFNKRSRLQANISQSLGHYGSVYLNAYQQDYWGQQGREKTVTSGYNSSWNSISYGLNYAYNDMPGQKKTNHLFSLSLNIPFDVLLPNSYIMSNMSTDNQGMSNFQLGVSGNSLDNKLNYSIQESYGNHGQESSGHASLAYRGGSGTLNSGYSYSTNTQRLNYGLQGGVVLHQDGLILSQPLGETIALVRAPNAGDVSVQNRTGITTNAKGYAVVPYLTPYQRNRIQLDVESLSEHVDLASNSTTVIPTRGAIVWADFSTHIGWRALININENGKSVPFGTIVTLVDSEQSSSAVVTGIVGDNGNVYLNGLPEQGRLQVKWGEEHDQQCHADFTLPYEKTLPVLQVMATCVTQ